MPCYEPESVGDDGIQCGAFSRYVDNEMYHYQLTATDREGMIQEHTAIINALHRRFTEQGFCLLQRAHAEESCGQVRLAKNTSAGIHTECPPLLQHRQAKNN